jgi:hypothetical protein
LLISVFIQKEGKKSKKIERSQTKFLVSKRSQKMPKSRKLAVLKPNWQPCLLLLIGYHYIYNSLQVA